MQTNIPIENKNFTDINPVVCGYQKCGPGHTGGITIRDYCLIHYVKKGMGFFEVEGNKATVSSGQIFILHKNQPGYYEADKNDPWEYIWIGFDGKLVEKLKMLNSQIVDFNSNLFDEIKFCEEIKNTRSEYLAGKLFEMMSILFEKRGENISYIKQVSDYIKHNYMHPLFVEDIAKMMNLNRRYLSRIFREEKGVSIKQYITQTKMDRAEQFLKQKYSVKNVAELVGYDDVFNFSKMYKKIKGCSPKNTREKILEF